MLFANTGNARASVKADPLDLDTTHYTNISVTYAGTTLACRAYEGLVYVAKPVDARYQSINIYVPAAYYDGKTVGGWNAKTAPIFFPNQVGGYMPSRPTGPNAGWGGAAISGALAAGFVVAVPGTRGWPLKNNDGQYYGKAPAAIVDLKAAIRYLRHNRTRIPGNTDRIVSNGTSAGGALSAMLGATGNAADYAPFLNAIGAAEERDDVYAASCYCPITNLDHADAAYEWAFAGINSYSGRGGGGTMTAEQIALSQKLKAEFPAYLNSLNLKSPQGEVLTLDASGTGSFQDYVATFIVSSLQSALDRGRDISGLTWVKTDGKRVASIDFREYLKYAGRMKTTPAFDDIACTTPETALFGSSTTAARHFTASSARADATHAMADARQIRMMNPMNYIGTAGSSTAKYWRVRHGAADRDTSIAVPIALTLKLQNSGSSVDMAVPWGQGHGGDYDLPDLFSWIQLVCNK